MSPKWALFSTGWASKRPIVRPSKSRLAGRWAKAPVAPPLLERHLKIISWNRRQLDRNKKRDYQTLLGNCKWTYILMDRHSRGTGIKLDSNRKTTGKKLESYGNGKKWNWNGWKMGIKRRTQTKHEWKIHIYEWLSAAL